MSRILLPLFLISLMTAVACNQGSRDESADEYTDEPRDAWQWPFAAESIWNMPIGSEAVYVDAKLEAAGNAGVDIQHIMELNAGDPMREVLGSETWGPGRCDGGIPLGFTLNVPDHWIVPDAGNSPYGRTPNGNFAFRLPMAIQCGHQQCTGPDRSDRAMN